MNTQWKVDLRAGLVAAGLAAVGAFGASSSGASSAVERGYEIALEAERRDAGWSDQTAELEMTLTNSHGESSRREIRTRALEVDGDGDKLLVIFDEPRDVRGTAFLTFTHKEGADDQWLYLPALKRVKRISSNNKSGPFMGSEFAYEDLTSQELEKYDYRYLRDEAVDGRSCHVVERVPRDEGSGYTRQVVWWDEETLRVEKVEFYDRKDELLKTLVYRGYQRYLERYWRADEMLMENHQTGKATLLAWNDYGFGAGLTERDFDQSSLRRAR